MLTFVLSPRFFPSVLIALQAAACVRYLAAGASVQASYWILAAGLNAVVAFGMGPK